MADTSDPVPGDDPREQFLVLVVQYFDGDLDAAETAELNAILRDDPACRRLFAEYATRACLIRETLDSERRRVEVPRSEEPSQQTEPARTRRRRKRALFAAGAAGLLAVAAAFVVVFWPKPPVPNGVPVVAAVEPSAGDVRVVAADGQVRVVAERTELRAGDTVRTEAVRGAAAVIYPDGTRLALAGDTAITCSGGERKTVAVHQGTVGASVSPQPEGRSMVLTTPAARIEVRGTEFSCQVSPDRTDVSVTKGRVRVTRTSDGKAVDVPERKRVRAEARVDLAVEDVPERPDTWELDFEQGLPPGMTRARFVTEGLPRGSKGGAGAIRSTRKGEEEFFEIVTPEAWQQGLFAFHPDSHLHVTYTIGEAKWVNVFVIARGAGPTGAHAGNYLFTDNEFFAPGRVGKWQTVTIPLAKLRRAGANSDAAPGPNEVPYLVVLSSQGDRGLVIDRIWVTRGGAGKVEYKAVE